MEPLEHLGEKPSMKKFRKFEPYDISHLQACFGAAEISAKHYYKHPDAARDFDIQVSHIYDFLNEAKAEDLMANREGYWITPEPISEAGGDSQIRITLGEQDIEVVGIMADMLRNNDGDMVKETEAAAEALFLFLLNRSKVIPS